jgi:hypothetical protein
MSKRNRNSQKGPEKEDRTGMSGEAPANYRKLKNNSRNRADQSVSTRDNPANGKYSKTNKRDEDVNNTDTRGGR